MKKHDLVIEKGNIISFGNEYKGVYNIGIDKGIISEITEENLHSDNIINAEGMIVSPGFIDFHSHVNGRKFSAECLLKQGATTTIGGERILDAQLLRDIERKGFIINHGFYISYSFTLRKAVGLHDPMQRATQSEIENMKKLAERFFQFGVLGIHFGLEYIPGTTEEELRSLLHLTKEHKKVAMIHLRKDGYEALEALEEIIRVAKETGAAVNLLHTMYTAGLEGLLDSYLKRIEEARREGCDITADTGVYAAYPTFIGSLNLSENWEKRHKRSTAEKSLMISSGTRRGQWCDDETFSYFRREFPTTLVTSFVYEEKQIEKAIVPDYMMISTNAAYGPHSVGVGHPEGAGTYPKLIAEYVRDREVLSLKEAINKISFQPARRLGIEKKGDIAKGYDADLTIFDLNKIDSRADYVGCGDPTASPLGIEYVIVNGAIVLKTGNIITDHNYGRFLKT